jgi:hypothetical protein
LLLENGSPSSVHKKSTACGGCLLGDKQLPL